MSLVDENFPTILLSHDPSHWTEQVVDYKRIDLQLAGHTHGMQFGIDIPGIKWSPVQWRYKQWKGLYNKLDKYIYVNTGVGNLAYAGIELCLNICFTYFLMDFNINNYDSVDPLKWSDRSHNQNLFINYNFLNYFQNFISIIHLFIQNGKNRIFANIFTINVKGLKVIQLINCVLLISFFEFKFLYLTKH